MKYRLLSAALVQIGLCKSSNKLFCLNKFNVDLRTIEGLVTVMRIKDVIQRCEVHGLERFEREAIALKEQDMIKISKKESDEGRLVVLKIEGKICGAWAREFKQTCQDILCGKVEQLTLDFSSVTSIDREGLNLLKKVDCPKIRIVGCNLFLKDLIEGKKLKQSVIEPEVRRS
jgi:anti-anti-sigma regulatory factor